MSTPHFVVPIKDLERGPKEVVWTLPEGWLRLAFADTEAVPVGEGELDVALTKSGREVVVQGSARARIRLPDALTNEPVEVELTPEIMLLLEPAPEPDGKSRGKRRQHAKKKAGGWDEDPELSDKEAARDTYSGEHVVLDGFVREFLLLEIPMTVHSDLQTTGETANAPPSAQAEAEAAHAVDPRLAPLAAIASRLRQKKE